MSVRRAMYWMVMGTIIGGCGETPVDPELTVLAAVAAAGEAVNDLRVTDSTETSLSLTWTQVSDGTGGTGSPAWYRVKYAVPPISWKTATIGCDSNIPGTEVGAPMSCTVEGLTLGTTYDIQLMSYRRLNKGEWRNALYSNIATATTTGAGPALVSVMDRISLLPLEGQAGVAPTAVNALGDVVGTSDSIPVRWESGVPVELPVLAGTRLNVPGSINASGQIAGDAKSLENGSNRTVLWDGDTVVDIGTLDGYEQSRGARIDNAGRIVGTAVGPNLPRRGFIWEDGALRELSPIPGFEDTWAVASNSEGSIIGGSYGQDFGEFNIWSLDGTIIWRTDGAGDPKPQPDGNEQWVGISDAGDAYIRGNEVGGMQRWRDGQLASWHTSLTSLAYGTDVSPDGLVLGRVIEEPTSTRGIWKSDRFYAFEDQTLNCVTLSGEFIVCARRDGPSEWFVGKLDFQGEP
jgi:uncharacterized membrane protein